MLTLKKKKNKLNVTFVVFILFFSFSADLHMEGSIARAPPGRTNYATQSIAPPTRLTTEHSSAQSSTANNSEDGTTPGSHTPKWTVRPEGSIKAQTKEPKWVVASFPSRSRRVQAVLLC